MYPYHNRIKQRIANGEMVGFWFVDDYPRIGTALILQFKTNPILRPIRPHRWIEYVGILMDWKKGNDEKDAETVVDVRPVCGGCRV